MKCTFIFLLGISCCVSCGQSQSEKDLQVPKHSKMISDSVVSIKEISDGLLNLKWESEWTKMYPDFSNYRFLRRKKGEGLNIEWKEVRERNDADGIKDLYQFNDDSTFTLDIYSYGIFMENQGKDVLIDFSGEFEVRVIDNVNKRQAILFHTGTYEIVQDCQWINKNEFLVFGCIQDSLFIPFIWKVNLSNNTYESFYQKKSYKHYPEDYFFMIHPEFKQN